MLAEGSRHTSQHEKIQGDRHTLVCIFEPSGLVDRKTVARKGADCAVPDLYMSVQNPSPSPFCKSKKNNQAQCHSICESPDNTKSTPRQSLFVTRAPTCNSDVKLARTDRAAGEGRNRVLSGWIRLRAKTGHIAWQRTIAYSISIKNQRHFQDLHQLSSSFRFIELNAVQIGWQGLQTGSGVGVEMERALFARRSRNPHSPSSQRRRLQELMRPALEEGGRCKVNPTSF